MRLRTVLFPLQLLGAALAAGTAALQAQWLSAALWFLVVVLVAGLELHRHSRRSGQKQA
jgi:hypothetical protein